jgi:hypothetical protein
MARIPNQELERLKREVSLARLIEGQGHKLASQNKDLACRCPWHDGDDTPSCVVSPKTNLWHCFSRDAGGSVIDWAMRSHKVSLRHACELLTNDNLRAGTPKHLYLPGPHRGVFNREGIENQKEIILCEALIDALTFWSAGYRNVTSSYGVNGFTDELLAAFKACGAQRVLIAFDRDEAGDRAAEALAKKLLAAGLDCFRLLFPKGMDANAYACAVKPPEKSCGVVIRAAEWPGAGAGLKKPKLTTRCFNSMDQWVDGDEALRAADLRSAEQPTSSVATESAAPLSAAMAGAMQSPVTSGGWLTTNTEQARNELLKRWWTTGTIRSRTTFLPTPRHHALGQVTKLLVAQRFYHDGGSCASAFHEFFRLAMCSWPPRGYGHLGGAAGSAPGSSTRIAPGDANAEASVSTKTRPSGASTTSRIRVPISVNMRSS